VLEEYRSGTGGVQVDEEDECDTGLVHEEYISGTGGLRVGREY
jgi:hypothetical protein